MSTIAFHSCICDIPESFRGLDLHGGHEQARLLRSAQRQARGFRFVISSDVEKSLTKSVESGKQELRK
jgi:hypothetical protein